MLSLPSLLSIWVASDDVADDDSSNSVVSVTGKNRPKLIFAGLSYDVRALPSALLDGSSVFWGLHFRLLLGIFLSQFA